PDPGRPRDGSDSLRDADRQSRPDDENRGAEPRGGRLSGQAVQPRGTAGPRPVALAPAAHAWRTRETQSRPAGGPYRSEDRPGAARAVRKNELAGTACGGTGPRN